MDSGITIGVKCSSIRDLTLKPPEILFALTREFKGNSTEELEVLMVNVPRLQLAT